MSIFQLGIGGRKSLPIVSAAVIISVIVISVLDNYLAVPLDLSIYDNAFGNALFIATVLVGYGVGSWFLLGYANQVTTKLRTKYPFVNVMRIGVLIIQFSLLAMLLFLIYNRNDILINLVFLISSIAASVILGLLSFKFFAWYRTSDKNQVLLYFALAAATLGAAILANIGTHMFLVKVVQQGKNLVRPPSKTSSMTEFVKPLVCNGRDCVHQIQGSMRMMKDIRNHTTVFYVVPASEILYRNYLNVVPYTLGFIFRWACTVVLLLHYYQRIDKLKFWILISIPLIFYLIGKTPLILGINQPYWFMILTNTGGNAISILFGILLFMIGRRVPAVKDYLTISAIGIIMVAISLSTSILQETFGIAAHSLVFLSSYLFCIGLYSSAISISQDSSLRASIRKSVIDLLDKIGTAQMEQDLQKRVLKLVRDKELDMEQQSGISSSLTEEEVKNYMTQVSTELLKTKHKPS